MRVLFSFFVYLATMSNLWAQNYTSYFIGNSVDTSTTAQGGNCLMGGATENDEAMRWFLRRANGGDVLVLRASGSDGYNNYMYSQLGVSINSVETIVFNQISANQELYIQQKIQQAEAIWFAGGNQWNYVNYWRNSPIDSLINIAIRDRNIVIGGTSAGMAIQGGYYFTAQNGTVTSGVALQNPYISTVTVDSARFLQSPFLDGVITDTHFDNPDRKGRLMVFMSRIISDYQQLPKAIACDEYTAVCVDTNGIGYVYGDYPNSDDNAYFIQTNCELFDQIPERCSPAQTLNWDLGGQAVKVYQLKGTNNGINSFNLNSWQSGNGGEWKYWYVNNGVLAENPAFGINCQTTSVIQPNPNNGNTAEISCFPNPNDGNLFIQAQQPIQNVYLYNSQGQLIDGFNFINSHTTQLYLTQYPAGYYIINIKTDKQTYFHKIAKQ